MKPLFSRLFLGILPLFYTYQVAHTTDNLFLDQFATNEHLDSSRSYRSALNDQRDQLTHSNNPWNISTLALNQRYDISQKISLQIFKVQILNSFVSQQHINVEVEMTSNSTGSPFKPLFAYKIGSPPVLVYDSHGECGLDFKQSGLKGKLSTISLS